jgi:hypothetical protein
MPERCLEGAHGQQGRSLKGVHEIDVQRSYTPLWSVGRVAFRKVYLWLMSQKQTSQSLSTRGNNAERAAFGRMYLV